MITFNCPQCRTSLQCEETGAGAKINCPTCNQKLQVPAPPSEQTMMGQIQPAENRTLVGVMPVDLKNAPMICCSGCGKQFQVKPELAGKRVRCKACGLVNHVPEPPRAAPLGQPIQCSCPHCNSMLSVDARSAGTKANCPTCGLPFEVPLPRASLTEGVAVTGQSQRGLPAEEFFVGFENSSLPSSSIACPFCSEPIAASAQKCKHCGEFLDAPRKHGRSSDKLILTAFLLNFFLGCFGAHRFYVGKIGSGIAMLLISLTFYGLVVTFVWALVDLIVILCAAFTDAEERPLTRWTLNER